jgi:small subunit ribosomal protein S17
MTDQITRTETGLVISSVRDKTITVIIERTIKHPLYKKILRRSTKIQAHDQENQCEDGDLVTI